MPRKVLLVAAAFLLASCTKEKRHEPVLQVVRASLVEQIQPGLEGLPPERYSVSIEPFAQVDLAFKSGGIVEHILQVRGADGRVRDVQAGDKVSTGTVLAQVRPLDYQYRLDQAEARRAQAEAQVAQAKAELAQARANFSEADIEYARARNLFRSASLVKPDYDQAKGRYDTGVANVDAAQAAVKAAEDGLVNARAAVKDAKLSLTDATLRAPFAGWIAARNVDTGSLVGNSTVGFTIKDTHLVKATFSVPDFTLSRIRPGQALPVAVDALHRSVPGVITSISPQADPQSRVFQIEVTMDNSREDIRPGMLGSVAVGRLPDSRPRLVVPLSAVVRAPDEPNGFAVFRIIQRDGKMYAHAQRVDVGQTFGNSIEVKQGLSAGQEIVALGAEQVRDGQQVNVVS